MFMDYLRRMDTFYDASSSRQQMGRHRLGFGGTNR